MTDKVLKVTDNTHEMSFHELFTRPSQIQIPLFQREYVWTEKQLNRMFSEIDKIVSGEDKTRFLGAVISVARDANPASPQPYEIVDGQQRLSTLFLFVLAGAYVIARHGDDDYAIGLINSSLIVPWWTSGPNTKLLPSFDDRDQFNSAMGKVLQVGNLTDKLTGKIILPEPTGNDRGRLLSQFERIRRRLQSRLAEKDIDHIKQMISAATTKMTFVFILLRDASNATTVFEGLNDPGIPIGIGDLVRNEVFSKIANEPTRAIEIHQQVWKPFHKRLGDGFDDYFFPFGITKVPSISRSELFSELRKSWADLNDPKDIILNLSDHVDDFNLIEGRSTVSKYPKKISDSIGRLRDAKVPSSTYPFLFHLLKAVRSNECSVEDADGCLKALESFLVRRAIVGREPTGLLVFFRTAWKAMDGKPSRQAFADALNKRGTIEWPNDGQLKEAILTRNIYTASIKNFLLSEYDHSLGGDVPLDIPWVEHVLPQSLNSNWSKKKDEPGGFSKADHDRLVHTWGNLIPLSQKMNQELSQSEYKVKRAALQKKSMYMSARNLADSNPIWEPPSIEARSKKIAKWATARWFGPKS